MIAEKNAAEEGKLEREGRERLRRRKRVGSRMHVERDREGNKDRKFLNEDGRHRKEFCQYP